jgi:Ca2+-binding RTX toxin-like protein
MDNLLQDVDQKLTFDQYAVSDYWTGEVDENGNPVLSTTVDTIEDVPYELEFNLAANLSADVESVTVDVIFDGESIGSFVHQGGVFETYTFDLKGTGDVADLDFIITDVTMGSDGSIDTSGVVPSYTKTVNFLGVEATVDAFAPGQNFIYQVLNGQLVKFDLETNSYTETEVGAAVNVNAIGYSAEDDLIYGLARSNGVDALGNPISKNDVIAMDAKGATYAVSPGQMGSYIGDVDDEGNLWTFSGNLSKVVIYDLSEKNPDGSLVSTTIDLTGLNISTKGLADLAYDATTETFYGVSHGGAPGLPGTLVSIDISEFKKGGDPIVTTQTIVGTMVDGQTVDGIPSSAFGATIVDSDGSVYIGANNADHDLNSSTPNAGGFYKVVTGEDGALYMKLLAEAPKVSSNDGAMDTRGIDPFLGIDSSSTVLLRAPVLTIAVAEDDTVKLAAKGEDVIIDLLANDKTSEGETLTLTHLNGVEVAVGDTVTLANGEVVTYLGGGKVSVSPGSEPRDVEASITYSIQNQSGVTDTGTLTISTSPVQGTAGNDHMVGFTDSDGTQIDGTDGLNDVILGYGGNDKIYAGHGNDDVYGGSGNDFIRAQNGDDLIHGEDGNDILDGGSGVDTMFGGKGKDTYFVDSSEDVVSEEGGDGTDTVKSKVDFVLGSGLENLWLSKGSAATTGTGNELRNMIVGNEKDNLIDGKGNNDNLMGGSGDDTMYGGEGHDKLHGNDGADEMFGGAGNDKLHGGTGNDITYGGSGNDILCPGVGDDTMYGGDGNDLLSGNLGADVAYGGDGNDTYKVSDASDTIIEFEGEGHDVVHATADVVLSEHVEDLVFMSSGNFVGTGNSGANRITGNSGNDLLSGAGGNDYLNGKQGNDVLSGDGGNDKVHGDSGNDLLSGGVGADTLSGGSGSDTLNGGQGDDFMCGDAGADVFVFSESDGKDTIKGFDVDEDRIELTDVKPENVTWEETNVGLSLHYGSGDTILLNGLSMDDLSSIDLVYL